MKHGHVALAPPRPPLACLKRLGVGGLLFFLVKGLLWLMVPALLALSGGE